MNGFQKTLCIVLFFVVFQVNGQKVIGFFPDWYAVEKMDSIDWDHLTDLVYCFAAPTDSATVSFGNIPQLPRLVEKGRTHDVKIHLSIGGLSCGSSGWNAVVATDDNREKFALEVVMLVRDYGLSGVNLDWEYPTEQQANDYAELLAKIKGGLLDLGEAEDREVELSIAVAAIEEKTAGISKAAIDTVDYIYVMAFVNDSCFNCGGPNHSSQYFAENGFWHWTDGHKERKIEGKQAQPEKIVLAIPFFDNDGVFYRECSKSDPQAFFQDEDGFYNDYFFNSCPMIEKKAAFIRQQSGAGLFAWEVVQDRHDQYSLLKCMYNALYRE